MKSITIKGSQRESVGKVATKALRNAGKVPCVIYGGESPIHFSAEELSFRDLVYTPNAYTAVIELENGQSINAVLQDIQFHPVTDSILHIDFFQLFDDKPVTMNIPVRLEGNSPGVRNGGRLLFRNRKLSVKALPNLLPDEIVVDISKLKIGGKVAVESLRVDEYTIMQPDNITVVQVKASRNAAVGSDEDEEDEEGGEAAEA
ncbi:MULTISPECIES: 50S ribosomal protein L25/general stress protein Ctc [Flavobacteriaceae]|uniref:50S ribosomal protein L25/general stress protein Ctc n=1 Tax=Flavobacteriaceae TaxID=49546 RepID=UPI0010AE57F4|nr:MULTISPECIES: 50S ribosomal protein L25/general stress protein Ctc [Flavobacteriaceae]NJB36401.1 50S ribosomal protein L25/general stress protein Ctc [Croceivirga sp. JEA036]TKD66500.1 50S ribosomal protein L25/general stress protein Ctc [Flavobacterium sp. ASW18X]